MKSHFGILLDKDACNFNSMASFHFQKLQYYSSSYMEPVYIEG